MSTIILQVGRPSNVPQAAPWIEQILDEARQYARIYVSSIHPDLTENDIKRYKQFSLYFYLPFHRLLQNSVDLLFIDIYKI